MLSAVFVLIPSKTEACGVFDWSCNANEYCDECDGFLCRNECRVTPITPARTVLPFGYAAEQRTVIDAPLWQYHMCGR